MANIHSLNDDILEWHTSMFKIYENKMKQKAHGIHKEHGQCYLYWHPWLEYDFNVEFDSKYIPQCKSNITHYIWLD